MLGIVGNQTAAIQESHNGIGYGEARRDKTFARPQSPEEKRRPHS